MQKITITQINNLLKDNGFSNLKAGKPSLLSPFVLVDGVDLWNNRIATFNTIKELKDFVLGYTNEKN